MLVDTFGVTQEMVADYVGLLRRDAVIMPPSSDVVVQLRDQDDVPIVAAAVQGGAEVFITGDKELLQLIRVRDVRVLSPREFWNALTA